MSIDFHIEPRGGIPVLVDSIGCRPATRPEIAMWQEIERLTVKLSAMTAEHTAMTIQARDAREAQRQFRADTARLDWLADPNNQIGNVQIPIDCVLAHPESMRAAIDMAMRMGTDAT